MLAKIREWTASPFIGDDCAVLPGFGLVTSDTLVEGTHFRLDWTDLVSLGYKACAVNLSDIAAMGGRPRFITVALTLPRDFGESELRRLYLGLTDCASRYRTRIAGGDLTGGDSLVITITAMGDIHEAGVMKRSGARPGDLVIVTGSFGASGTALALLRNREHDYEEATRLFQDKAVPRDLMRPGSQTEAILERHFKPEPRLEAGWALVESCRGRGALMDASDGLGDALLQIAAASQVALSVDLAKVPIERGVERICLEWGGRDPMVPALYGGEDYELVGTVSEDVFAREEILARHFKVIGRVEEGLPGLVRFVEDGKATERLSGFADFKNCFQHF